MLTSRFKISLSILTCLLVLATASLSARAATVTDVSVDVPSHQGNYVGEYLVDGNTATAWVPGGKSTGPGKWIVLDFPAPVKLQSLSIANGNQGKGAFKKFRRVTKGIIQYPDGERQSFRLKPNPGVQKIKLLPKSVSTLKIVILGVAPSSRDKSLGKAKVAISEITIFGKIDTTYVPPVAEEPADDTEATPTLVVDDTPAPAKEKTVAAAKSAPVPAPEPKQKSKAKAAPKKKAAPAHKAKAKPEPAPKKAEPKAAPKPVEKKGVVKPKPKSEPKQVAKKAEPKPAPKKQTAKPKKATPKKKAAAPKPKATQSSSATQPGIAFLQAAKPVPAGSEIATGTISPWLNLEPVAMVKRYFAWLTTLHDSYSTVFATPIQQREQKTFLAFQNEMRAKKRFGEHHMAMIEHMGLNFDKPVAADGAAMIRVHGPYRYYVGNQGYEFHVDANFTFVHENGKWVIDGVLVK